MKIEEIILHVIVFGKLPKQLSKLVKGNKNLKVNIKPRGKHVLYSSDKA